MIDKGVALDEIKLYGEPESKDALDDSFMQDSFGELEEVITKVGQLICEDLFLLIFVICTLFRLAIKAGIYGYKIHEQLFLMICHLFFFYFHVTRQLFLIAHYTYHFIVVY